MQSELAEALNLSVPTVKEHLDAMKKAELVEVKDEGRKWKYYELTKKGKAILEPEDIKIWIVLSLFILAVVGGLAGWLRGLLAPFYSGERFSQMVAEKQALAAEEALAEPAKAMADATAQAINPWVIVYLVILAVLGALLLYYIIKRTKGKA